MASNVSVSPFQGLCPAPFFQESLFTDGGYVGGRFCTALGDSPSCCLSCPSTDWLYSDNFNQVTRVASWINVVSMICSIFLLLSFILLPVAHTHRHYLSVCLVISIIVMQLGFLVPLAAKPDQCYDLITPNDQKSSIVCALSGTFLLLGGWASLMWVCVRSIALNLQICWQQVIGKRFMAFSYALGWVLPAAGVTNLLILSGVSFRFGDTCHINHGRSMADLWGPLLGFAGITLIIQFITFGYCIKVYLQSLNTSEISTTNSSALPSYTTSIRVSPRQAYRRIRRVMELQWRGICIVLVIVTDVIFFSVVFVFFDSEEQGALDSKTEAIPWIECLVTTLDKNHCLQFTKSFAVNEATVMAVLILLCANGIWALLLLGRLSIFIGWWELIQDKLGRKKGVGEFVSVDATRGGFSKGDTKSYEMLDSPGQDLKKPDPILSQLTMDPMSPFLVESPISSIRGQTPISPPARVGGRTPDYFGIDSRYVSPIRSFSTPRPPSAGGPSNQPARYDIAGMDPLAMNKI